MRESDSPHGRPPLMGRLLANRFTWFALVMVIIIVVSVRSSIRAGQFLEAVKSAEAHLAAGELQEAQADLAAARTIDPNNRQAKALQSSIEQALATEATYRQAGELMAQQKWTDAIPMLEALGPYKDTGDRLRESRYQIGRELLASGQPAEAISQLEQVKGHKDSSDLLSEAHYTLAAESLAQEEWVEARTHLLAVPADYKDATELLASANDTLSQQYYQEAKKKRSEKDYVAEAGLLKLAKEIGGRLPAKVDLDKELAAAKTKAGEQERQARLDAIRDKAQYFDSSPVSIAIGGAKFRKAVGTHSAGENGTFVVVHVGVLNNDFTQEHANPNNFTLATPDGYTVSPHIETYGLSSYFDAVDLATGQRTSGWLVFYAPKSATYTLHYNGFNASTRKELAPES